MVKLSILIPTVPSRLELFYPRIIKELLRQIGNSSDIELVALFDNKKRSVGEKRQNLIDIANGEYLTFIDDDDRISPDYISCIMNALYSNLNTDCVVYDTICCVDNGALKKLCKYGIEFEYGDILGGREWRGKPAHTMIYKSSIAKKHAFKNINHGEDVEWVKRACKDIVVQTRIDKVLYYYDANYTTTSETVGLSDAHIKANVEDLLKNKSN